MQHCINELESNINIQYIRSYFYVALQLFDTTNGLQKEKKTCMKPLPHLFSLWTSPQATDPQSLMHFLFFHQTLALHCFTVTPNKTSVQACNLTNICQLWNPELQHFTLILLFLHTQTRHMGPLPPVQMGIRRRPWMIKDNMQIGQDAYTIGPPQTKHPSFNSNHRVHQEVSHPGTGQDQPWNKGRVVEW